jgi:hypothetical protein
MEKTIAMVLKWDFTAVGIHTRYMSSVPVMACGLAGLCLKGTKKRRPTAVPIHAMKAHRWSGGIAPLILDLGTK